MEIRRRTPCLPLLLALAAAVGACSQQDDSAEATNTYQLEGTGPERYERILVPPLFAPWADDLIARAGVQNGDEVLDIATGTGVVARKVAAIVGPEGAVTALDISPAMLAAAREAAAPAAPAIEWVEGDALALPFENDTFDVVFCQQALQFFPDRAKAIQEMHRVLRPGGRVAVSAWRAPEHNPYGEEFARIVSARVGPEAGMEATGPFAWDDADELETLMTSAGFERVAVEPVVINMTERALETFIINDLLAYPALGRTLAEWDTPRKDALVAAMLDALGQYRTGDSWSIPWASNVGVAVK